MPRMQLKGLKKWGYTIPRHPGDIPFWAHGTAALTLGVTLTSGCYFFWERVVPYLPHFHVLPRTKDVQGFAPLFQRDLEGRQAYPYDEEEVKAFERDTERTFYWEVRELEAPKDWRVEVQQNETKRVNKTRIRTHYESFWEDDTEVRDRVYMVEDMLENLEDKQVKRKYLNQRSKADEIDARLGFDVDKQSRRAIWYT